MEKRGVAWRRAKDRFSVNDLFVIAREVKFAFFKLRHRSGRIFSPLRQRIRSSLYPRRKENEIRPLNEE